MAKERSDKKDKADKKVKKEKRAERDGVSKSKSKKKDKADAVDSVVDVPTATLVGEETVALVTSSHDDNGDSDQAAVAITSEIVTDGVRVRPIGAVVPFANPLADDKGTKKVLKSVRKASKAKALKRGVKEVVKALRKSPPASAQAAAVAGTALPLGIVVLAADISPMDVISHLPVLCEDHGMPYIYVRSRADLGAASSTKRPTSVVMVSQDRKAEGPGRNKAINASNKTDVASNGTKDAAAKADAAVSPEEWDETYRDLTKFVRKAARDVRI